MEIAFYSLSKLFFRSTSIIGQTFEKQKQALSTALNESGGQNAKFPNVQKVRLTRAKRFGNR